MCSRLVTRSLVPRSPPVVTAPPQLHAHLSRCTKLLKTCLTLIGRLLTAGGTGSQRGWVRLVLTQHGGSLRPEINQSETLKVFVCVCVRAVSGFTHTHFVMCELQFAEYLFSCVCVCVFWGLTMRRAEINGRPVIEAVAWRQLE